MKTQGTRDVLILHLYLLVQQVLRWVCNGLTEQENSLEFYTQEKTNI